MGCACSRHMSLDKGSYSMYTSDSPGYLFLQVVILDQLAEHYFKKVEIEDKHSLIVSHGKVQRIEKTSTILENGYLFSFNTIEFDEARIDMLYSPMTFEINLNENFFGLVNLANLKHSLFLMSKENAILKDSNENEMPCEVYYGVSGSFFFGLRTLELKHLTEDEQLNIVYKLIQARNNENTVFGKGRNLLRHFLQELKTEIRVQIFEKLVQLPAEKSGHIIKEFLTYFNPYQFTLQLSFRNFMKNIVSHDEGLEDYARNLIESNRDDFLIYENKESFCLMLKQAFYRGEDPKGYFKNHLKNNLGVSEKFQEMLGMPGILEKVFIPAVQRDKNKFIKVLNILMKFQGLEEFLETNSQTLNPLLKLDDVLVDETNSEFMAFAMKKMGKIENS